MNLNEDDFKWSIVCVRKVFFSLRNGHTWYIHIWRLEILMNNQNSTYTRIEWASQTIRLFNIE